MAEIKERNLEISSNSIDEKGNIIDIGQENIGREPIPREIKTWIDKVEQISTSQPNTIGDDGQITPSSSNFQNPQTIIPVTRKSFIAGFKKTWQDAGRWLSSFWLRFIKIKKGNITFKSHDTD